MSVAELDGLLQALLQLKAPGITKSRIAAITSLCIENVKSESILVQKIFTHFKRAPATHKLGVLYVIDAVTRQWIDKAGAAGQDLTADAPQDGTFAAGVHKMTELLPTMMNDLIPSVPLEQKEKISKLVDIWDRGSIFPASMVKGFKTKIEARGAQGAKQSTDTLERPGIDQLQPSTTQQGPSLTSNLVAQASSNATDFLAGLSSIPSAPAATSSIAYNGIPTPNLPAQHSLAPQQPVVAPQPAPAAAQPAAGITPEQVQALSSVIPADIVNDPVALQQHLQLLQQLVTYNVPTEQWPIVIEAMRNTPNPAAQFQAAAQAAASQPPQTYNAPPPPQQARDRSRSPQGLRNGGQGFGAQQGNGTNYRQRSPLSNNPAAAQADMIPLQQPRWTGFDPALPTDHIRVLSRTLFIGGTQCGEEELRRIFGVFGSVQTCIPNPDKRHAFIKYHDRAGAVAAREGFGRITDPAVTERVRSVRWGVGFGPRDCNDYNTGVSVIPIHRLTEADRKWVVSAPFGGSGGKPIETGLVIEEPDIEIGAGVSSKAISRRVNGTEGKPQRQHGGGGGGGGGGGDRHGRNRNRSPNQQPLGQGPGQQQYTQQQQPAYEAGYGLPPPQAAFPGFPGGGAPADPSQFRYT